MLAWWYSLDRKIEKQIKDDFTIITKTELIHPEATSASFFKHEPCKGQSIPSINIKFDHSESKNSHLTKQTKFPCVSAFFLPYRFIAAGSGSG